MAQYIDKDAVVAEIERRIKELQPCNTRENLRAHGSIAGYYQILSFINSMQEVAVSEDLEEAAIDYDSYRPALYGEDDEGDYVEYIEVRKDAFIAGANWQKEQFEKNRLAHCDAQTDEEAEIERDFVMGIIENEHRQPTFDDAIKYGMRLKKEQMIANTSEAMIGLPYENKYGGYTQLIDVSRPLPVGNNKIAIIFN